MKFDQTSVLALARLALDKSDKRRTDDLRLAMSAACDDMVLRMRSHSYVRSYTVDLAADDREVTLSGDNYDLKYIFALKIGTGDDQKVLIPEDEQQFLRDYDNPSEEADLPTYYSILEADESGYPKVPSVFCFLRIALSRSPSSLSLIESNISLSLIAGTVSHRRYGRNSCWRLRTALGLAR